MTVTDPILAAVVCYLLPIAGFAWVMAMRQGKKKPRSDRSGGASYSNSYRSVIAWCFDNGALTPR